jgi:hypothetical protein
MVGVNDDVLANGKSYTDYQKEEVASETQDGVPICHSGVHSRIGYASKGDLSHLAPSSTGSAVTV